MIFLLTRLGQRVPEAESISTGTFIGYLEEGRVEELTKSGPEYVGKLDDGSNFSSYSMNENFYDDYIKDLVDKKEINFNEEPIPQTPWYVQIFPSLLLIGLMIGAWYVLMTRTQGGGGQMSNFGKSKATLHKDEGEKVTFNQVAGLEEEKEELSEIVDFLRSPKKYINLGARIPNGVLLIGPPGTGKTYISKAVAGEAGVPFYSISGSDFVEMFVGVGASRVRDLFNEAKKNAPCIIFIDEIDAVGRARGAGLGGGHDEREQTLNQLLVEMDGFTRNEGIIVMAATNRPDILDSALTRPGRFDRQVYIGMPDVKGRYEILQVHARNKKVEPDVDLRSVAKATAGFTPADLENLTNEAALLAARNNLPAITNDLIEEAALKVVAGPAKKSRVVIEKERVLTAYHEAGHAVVSRMLPNEDPVHMISIVPRGRAGGFTAYLPKEERQYMTKKGMEESLVSLLGGRAAEAVVLDDISTGASNDIERATQIAKNMVTVYGMSDKLGPIKYGSDSGDVFLGRDIGKSRDYSEEVASEIDEEVRGIIEDAYQTALAILKENESLLHSVAKRLLEEETISGEVFEDLYQVYSSSDKEAEIADEVIEVKKIEEKTDKILHKRAKDDETEANGEEDSGLSQEQNGENK